MDNMYPAYNQAGPSNYSGAYTPNLRPPLQHGPGRGRGYKTSQQHYPHPQHAPFYATGSQGSEYTGAPIHGGNEGYGSLHGTSQYGYNPGPPVRHPPTGPAAPPAPLLPSHPSHLYTAHPGFYPPVLPPPHGSPLYHTAVPPPHVQSYSTTLTSPSYYPPYSHTPSPNIPPTSLNAPASTIPTSRIAPETQTPSYEISQNSNQQSDITLQSSKPAPTEASDVAIGNEEVIHTPQEQRLPEDEKTEEPTPIESPSTSKDDGKPVFFHDDEPLPSTDFVLFAHRPKDPRQAPGFSISVRAFPKNSAMKAVLQHPPVCPSLPPEESKVPEVTKDIDAKKLGDGVESSTTSNDLPSGSATETESRASTGLEANTPASPWTTSTSVSSGPSKTEVDVTENVKNADVSAVNNDSSPSKPVEEIAPESGKETVKEPIAASTTKKSWASLFAGNSSSQHSSLPKSDVIGFSVSAADLAGKPRVAPIGARRKDLISLLNDGPRTTSPLPAKRPRGLTNTGNMCFANAVLQTLVYTPLFLRFFTEFERCGPKEDDDTYEADRQLIPLVSAVVEFLKEFKPSKEIEKGEDEFRAIDSFNPSIIYDAMKGKSRFDNMGGGQQEDAEEFFGFFLDALEDELLALTKSLSGSNTQEEHGHTQEEDGWLEVGKKNRATVTRTTKSASSPMTRIFGGKFRSTLKVPGQRDSAVLEDWRSLKLEIESDDVKSVEDALRYVSHPQQVQLTSVTKGGATVNGSQQFLIESFPPVLVLHLKRFHYDTKVFDVVKLRKQVDFGPELTVPSDIIAPAQRSVHPVKYKLFSVVYHHGHSAAGGHYTADVLHTHNSEKGARPQESWIRIDDELVSDVREQDVFGKDRDCAYLLFYRRLPARAAVRA